jgi:hypothetical protein
MCLPSHISCFAAGFKILEPVIYADTTVPAVIELLATRQDTAQHILKYI